MIFGTAVGTFWIRRKLKGKEASSLYKMAIGTIIMGTGFLMMTGASIDVANSLDGKGAMIWLIAAYLLHTIGELCASPVALSFVTKLAPLKYASFMMGAYFAATGIGNKVAGLLGEYSSSWGELETFTGIAIFAMVFGGLIIALLKPLKRLTHGAEDSDEAITHDEQPVVEPEFTA